MPYFPRAVVGDYEFGCECFFLGVVLILIGLLGSY